jgi:hypothetical protein
MTRYDVSASALESKDMEVMAKSKLPLSLCGRLTRVVAATKLELIAEYDANQADRQVDLCGSHFSLLRVWDSLELLHRFGTSKWKQHLKVQRVTAVLVFLIVILSYCKLWLNERKLI